MDQVDVAETGVVTRRVLEAVGQIAAGRPELCDPGRQPPQPARLIRPSA